jgi:hypothetical protein
MRKPFPRPSDIAAELQGGFHRGYRSDRIAGADEDPNISHACHASPPCYMHELDPVCFDVAADADTGRFLRALLVEWTGSIRPIGAMCAAITEGSIAADLKKIHDQVVTHCRQLGAILGPTDTETGAGETPSLHDFTERSEIRHGLIGQVRLLLPDIPDGALCETLSHMVAVFPDTELTVLIAATLLNLRQLEAADLLAGQPLP